MWDDDQQQDLGVAADELRLRVVEAPFDDADTLTLLQELDAENTATYGSPDREPVQRNDFTSPSGLFIVGYDAESHAVACGGYRLRKDIRPGSVDAELKRMYVRPALRGRGYGARILAALEQTATSAGASRAILETGTRSTAAFAMYQRKGYTLIPLFSDAYAESPTNRAMAKSLDTVKTH